MHPYLHLHVSLVFGPETFSNQRWAPRVPSTRGTDDPSGTGRERGSPGEGRGGGGEVGRGAPGTYSNGTPPPVSFSESPLNRPAVSRRGKRLKMSHENIPYMQYYFLNRQVLFSKGENTQTALTSSATHNVGRSLTRGLPMKRVFSVCSFGFAIVRLNALSGVKKNSGNTHSKIK